MRNPGKSVGIASGAIVHSTEWQNDLSHDELQNIAADFGWVTEKPIEFYLPNF